MPCWNGRPSSRWGPGWGTDDWAREMFDAAMASELPLVVDADGLNLLAGSDAQRDNWILTPHPGEAARLLECTVAEVQADRRAALAGIQEKFGGIAVLKGSGTLVTSSKAQPWLCSAGNPGMASAGMGDALTGIIAGLRAQKLSAEVSAIIGVQVHAQAGDLAAAAGQRGLLATDLIAEVRRCVNP